MNATNNKVSFEFATNEMRTNGTNIRKWANQSDNLLLKSLANEVIAIAGGNHASR